MTFTSEGSILEWRGEGETLRIEPWGTDSVRIRSSKKMPISEQNWGLLGEHHDPAKQSASKSAKTKAWQRSPTAT